MGRTRRVLSHGWRTIALVGTFVSSSVVGQSLHANMPVVRRLAAHITNSALTVPDWGAAR